MVQALSAGFLLVFATILQTTVVVNFKLLHGAADLVLLVMLSWILQAKLERGWPLGLAAGVMVGTASELPMWLVLGGYLGVVLVVQAMQYRIWQAPMLILFVTAILGSMLMLGASFIYLFFQGVPLPLGMTVNQVVLPSVILNLLLALPVYGLVGETVRFISPPEIDV